MVKTRNGQNGAFDPTRHPAVAKDIEAFKQRMQAKGEQALETLYPDTNEPESRNELVKHIDMDQFIDSAAYILACALATGDTTAVMSIGMAAEIVMAVYLLAKHVPSESEPAKGRA